MSKYENVYLKSSNVVVVVEELLSMSNLDDVKQELYCPACKEAQLLLVSNSYLRNKAKSIHSSNCDLGKSNTKVKKTKVKSTSSKKADTIVTEKKEVKVNTVNNENTKVDNTKEIKTDTVKKEFGFNKELNEIENKLTRLVDSIYDPSIFEKLDETRLFNFDMDQRKIKFPMNLRDCNMPLYYYGNVNVKVIKTNKITFKVYYKETYVFDLIIKQKVYDYLEAKYNFNKEFSCVLGLFASMKNFDGKLKTTLTHSKHISLKIT